MDGNMNIEKTDTSDDMAIVIKELLDKGLTKKMIIAELGISRPKLNQLIEEHQLMPKMVQLELF